ncbi:hypothetical protein N7494_007405 [Penicillium frequentans]|uniref:Uncharacterized protein n=1 Tax=Penicillium frequentans TaxID=3151616 RepID=A0AAD6GER1_9EURO|nr:hypothetical protein N7494_007405 [Penicillium glabrum]
MHALPETHVDVDFMIVDYLACLAIDSTLVAIGRQTQGRAREADELNWQIDSLQGKLTAGSPMISDIAGINPPGDPIASGPGHQIATTDSSRPASAVHGTGKSNPGGHMRLSTIGLGFMGLCSTASAKVSETRWFDTGARFMVQAVLEGRREGIQPSEDLHKLCSWTPSEPAQISKWGIARQRYAGELSDASAINKAQSVALRYPLLEFKAIVGSFLCDLMTTLDAPILIQVERGQLEGLSPEETQRLKARVGLR